MNKAGYPYEFEDIIKVKVGGKKMYKLKGTVDYGTAVVTTQEVYSTLIDEYALCFIVTYIKDEEKAETDRILESVAFK
ncbi:hypothetical protein [Paenibacillus sp. sgz5001063]|uniref:hypothetical protein n=1 Tax=Paenibacillus sp. sgz5001063 TaxID=3242474 RepID=UPI0036D2A4B6